MLLERWQRPFAGVLAVRLQIGQELCQTGRVHTVLEAVGGFYGFEDAGGVVVVLEPLFANGPEKSDGVLMERENRSSRG